MPPQERLWWIDRALETRARTLVPRFHTKVSAEPKAALTIFLKPCLSLNLRSRSKKLTKEVWHAIYVIMKYKKHSFKQKNYAYVSSS